MRKYPEENPEEYTTVRLSKDDYALLRKAKTKMEKDKNISPSRKWKFPLGWTIGTLAEYYLLAKKRKLI